MTDVAIFNSSYTQVLTQTLPVRAEINRGSLVPSYPVDTGGTKNDTKIILPVAITVTLHMGVGDWQSAYKELSSLFAGEELLTIKTRSGVYPNMTIARLPHKEDADVIGTLIVDVAFVEMQLSTSTFVPLPQTSVLNPDHSSTISSGDQNPAVSTDTQASTLYKLMYQ